MGIPREPFLALTELKPVFRRRNALKIVSWWVILGQNKVALVNQLISTESK